MIWPVDYAARALNLDAITADITTRHFDRQRRLCLIQTPVRSDDVLVDVDALERHQLGSATEILRQPQLLVLDSLRGSAIARIGLTRDHDQLTVTVEELPAKPCSSPFDLDRPLHFRPPVRFHCSKRRGWVGRHGAAQAAPWEGGSHGGQRKASCHEDRQPLASLTNCLKTGFEEFYSLRCVALSSAHGTTVEAVVRSHRKFRQLRFAALPGLGSAERKANIYADTPISVIARELTTPPSKDPRPRTMLWQVVDRVVLVEVRGERD